MTLLAVKFYSQNTDPYYEGFPDIWPWEIRYINEESDCLPDELPRTREQINTVMAENQALVDAWWEAKRISEIQYSEEEKWKGLQNVLRGSEVFGFAYTASKQSIAAQMPMTLLIDALSNRNLDDLRFAFNDLRVELADINSDFTAEQLNWIQTQLETWQFESIDFNLI